MNRCGMKLVKFTGAPGHRVKQLPSLGIFENRLTKYLLNVFYILLILFWSKGMDYVLLTLL